MSCHWVIMSLLDRMGEGENGRKGEWENGRKGEDLSCPESTKPLAKYCTYISFLYQPDALYLPLRSGTIQTGWVRKFTLLRRGQIVNQ